MTIPPAGGKNFTLDSDADGQDSGFAIDELHISNEEKSPDAIRMDASRTYPFAQDEVFRALIGTF
jgi:hypothetical protein